MSRYTYGTRVNDVDVVKLTQGKMALAVMVGVDVGRHWLFAVCRWADGTFARPWKIANAGEIGDLVGLLRRVQVGRKLVVVMESSGTYGDALRQALSDAGIEVARVSGKAAHDYAEVFDGVPSQHDGKDAAVVASLRLLLFFLILSTKQNESRETMRLTTAIITGVLILLFGLALSHYYDLTTSRERVLCTANLHQVALALKLYRQKHGRLPPPFLRNDEGKPAHSWRVLLLEIIDHDSLNMYRFDEAWDGPNNSRLAQKLAHIGDMYSCSDKGKTNIFLVTGQNTLFENNGEKVTLATGNNPLLLVESVTLSAHWMEPVDLNVGTMSFAINDLSKPSISTKYGRRPQAMLFDETLTSLDQNMTADQLKQLIFVWSK